MQSQHQVRKLLQNFLLQKTLRAIHLLPKSLCTATSPLVTHDPTNSPESPDLPNWLRNSQNPKTADPDNDDFVIPSLAAWVEKIENHKQASNHLLFEAKNSDNDVDKVGEILMRLYRSEESVFEALNGCGVQVTNTLVAQLLERFSSNSIIAFCVFTWAKNKTGYVHTPDLYNFMVDILGKCKRFSLMWEVVEEMNVKGYVSLVTMTKVMRRLARAGRYDDAIEAFRGIERFGVNKNTEALNSLMDALVKERSVEHAHYAFMEFKGCIQANSHCYNILIHGYCKARKLDDARKTMEEMEKHGFAPDIVLYTCFIETYCRLKDFRNVDLTLDEMQEKGCKPNVITYTIIMHALGKAKEVSKALEVYEKMKRHGCVPDCLFYSSLIFILSKSGRIKDAWDVFEDMEKQSVSKGLITYNTMIASACVHSQDETALKLLKRMEEESCKPDIKTYQPLLSLFCRKKRMTTLRFLLSHMFKNNVSIHLDTYALLVRMLCKNSNLEYACFFFEETVLNGMVPMDCTYRMLVKELERKNMKQAKEKIEKFMLHAQERSLLERGM